MREILEKDIERHLVKEIKNLGGLCYKFVSPGNSGVPDRIVILPDKIIFVELKTEKGRLSALQKRQIKKIEEHGNKVQILYGVQDVERFIERCKCEVEFGGTKTT